MDNKTNFSIQSKKDRKAKLHTISLSGDLGIGNATAIRKKLQAMDYKYDVSIELSQVESIDLSFLQIIYALIRTMNTYGLKAHVKTEFPERIQEVLKNTGFNELVNININ